MCVRVRLCESTEMLIHAPYLHCNPPFCSIQNPHKSKLISRNRRNLKSVEKDSEFEVDPDEAREALKNLDKQLQSLSTKKLTTPKIRAREVKQWSYEGEEEVNSGSFWAYAASFLLFFTIFYNIFFLTVIKPSIDLPLPPESTDAMQSIY